jgi:hypothetical protein
MTAQLCLPLGGHGDLIGRMRAFGLPAQLAVTLHQNRRVMVSVDRRGALRVHRGYAFASDEVVAALVSWARPRVRRVDRRAAARTFLQFPVHQYVAAPPPRRRVIEPIGPLDEARLARLRSLHEILDARWFEGKLGPIRIGLSRRMRRKLGHYGPRSQGEPAIVISLRHLRRDGWARAAETLLHEMVHQWQDQNGFPVDHGRVFRRKARAVGIEPVAVAGSLPPCRPPALPPSP